MEKVTSFSLLALASTGNTARRASCVQFSFVLKTTEINFSHLSLSQTEKYCNNDNSSFEERLLQRAIFLLHMQTHNNKVKMSGKEVSLKKNNNNLTDTRIPLYLRTCAELTYTAVASCTYKPVKQ